MLARNVTRDKTFDLAIERLRLVVGFDQRVQRTATAAAGGGQTRADVQAKP